MNCIIIDDEPLARQGMELQLKQIASLSINGIFKSAIDASVFLQNNKTDLIFLDINMPELNGLDFVRSIASRPLIIFVTAYPQYALDSYEIDAVDYLVKPVRIERLLKAVNKAEHYLKLFQSDQNLSQIDSIAEEYIFIKSERKFFKVYFNEILYIEGLKDYVVIQLENRKLITAMNTKTIASQLPKSTFARISKSYIVNISHIISFDSFNVYLKTDELPIGSIYKDEFFKNYVNGKLLKR